MADTNMEYVPNLSFGEQAAALAEAEETAPDEVNIDAELEKLSEAERKAVTDFAQKIDITDSNAVLQYGASSQKNISDFSETTLKVVRTKDMGEVGDMLSDLVVELKSFNYDDEKKGIFGIKKKIKNQIASMQAQYSKAETNVDKISELLEQHQITLLKDVATLDKMYGLNQSYFKELTMYILAGKEKLKECREVTLPELKRKAEETGLAEDAQAANDYANLITRFEKKIYDLELTRTVSVQMAPQIRLIQNNDSLMVEKIQTSLINTIPLWKNQMVLALGVQHSQQAMEAQREVTNMTNELLKKNTEKLKTGSIEIAKESERGVVDIETLKETNQALIDTLEEVRTIQTEGAAKRREAEEELNHIENELKKKLLEFGVQ